MEKRARRALDDVEQSEICAILAVGCSRTVAAHYVGCDRRTIQSTALRDPDFAAALEKAESKHEIAHLTHINAAAKESRYWRASAWALERAYPNRYGQREAQSITVEQISQVLAQFADAILDEVTDDEQQQKIFQRLTELNAEFQDSAAQGDAE